MLTSLTPEKPCLPLLRIIWAVFLGSLCCNRHSHSAQLVGVSPWCMGSSEWIPEENAAFWLSVKREPHYPCRVLCIAVIVIRKTLASVYEVLIFCTRYQTKGFIGTITLTPENISRQILLCPLENFNLTSGANWHWRTYRSPWIRGCKHIDCSGPQLPATLVKQE